MDLKEEILKEHSAKQARLIADYAGQSAHKFQQLMYCFLNNEYRVGQRAAYAVSMVADTKPELLINHVGTLVDQLARKDVHNAVIRNSLRILQQLEIPESFHGRVMEACFRFIEDPKTPVAFKAFSLTILGNLCKSYPEIKSELLIIIEDRWEHETPAFKSRARKIIKTI